MYLGAQSYEIERWVYTSLERECLITPERLGISYGNPDNVNKFYLETFFAPLPPPPPKIVI